jgi:hypothetical protein
MVSEAPAVFDLFALIVFGGESGLCPRQKKSAKEWEMVDVRRPESFWCQTCVIFVIRQETLLLGGYMQRGVEIRHASEWDNKRAKVKFDASARDHMIFSTSSHSEPRT